MKIKLRDMTEEQYDKWYKNNCCEKIECENCIFDKVICELDDYCWVCNKGLYSDKFLNQEVEIKYELILTDEERMYLQNVIKPFRNKICYIRKWDDTRDYDTEPKEYIEINLVDDNCVLPSFKSGTHYKGMTLNEEYTLEELEL